MSTRVSPAFESVELNSSSSVSADAQLMLSDSTQTAGGKTTDPTGASEQEASPAAAAVENSPTEKQTKKRKKKGICAFFRRIGKAIKLCTLCCYGDDVLPPFPCDDPADLQPGLSGLEWALSIDPCPSGIELTVNADPADPEPSSVSGPSSLEVTPDSDPADPEPSLVPGPSNLNLKLTLDQGLSELVSEMTNVPGSSSLEVTPVPSLSSIELKPDVDPAEPKPSSVSGPSTLDSEITPVPGPSDFGADVGQQSKIRKKKGICAFFRRTWKAVKHAALCCQRGNKVAPDPFATDPVAHRDSSDLPPVLFSLGWLTVNAEPTYLEPSPVPGPSTLNNETMPAPRQSGYEPAVEKQAKMRKKKDIQAFFQRTWRTIKFSFLAPDPCDVEPMAHRDPVDLQSGLSSPFCVLTADPGPSGFEVTVMTNQDPADSQPGLFSLDSQLTFGPGPADLVQLMSVPGPSGHNIIPVRSPHSLRLTPDMGLDVPEPKPIPGSSDLELTADMGLDVPEPKPIPGSSDLELTADMGLDVPEPKPIPGSSDLELTADMGLDVPETKPIPGSSDLELTANMGLDVPEPKPIPGSSLQLTPDVDLADPEPSSASGPSSYRLTPDTNPKKKPVPVLSGLWPTAASFSSLYDVGMMLGKGGFGSVYEGTRRSNGQKFAMKFLPKKSWNTFINVPGSTQPILSEVAMNVMVCTPPKSPHIVQMIEWFDQPHQYIIVMEYPHPCETLLAFTVRHGNRLDETVARGLMRQAVLAAKHCIERGVFHNDIKTDNMLVNTETLQLKLIDFGCSERINTSCSKGRELAVGSTVWCLAMVLLDIVSGDQSLSVFLAETRDPLISNFSNEFRDLIEQCLVRHQSKRPTLEQILEHQWFKQD